MKSLLPVFLVAAQAALAGPDPLVLLGGAESLARWVGLQAVAAPERPDQMAGRWDGAGTGRPATLTPATTDWSAHNCLCFDLHAAGAKGATFILTAVGEPAHDERGQTIILVPDLVNRSTAPDGGVIELAADLRGQLAAAGEASHLAFIDQSALGRAARAHYILEGEAFTVQRDGQRYWEVFFTLYDVDSATGSKHDRRWEAVPGYLVPR